MAKPNLTIFSLSNCGLFFNGKEIWQNQGNFFKQNPLYYITLRTWKHIKKVTSMKKIQLHNSLISISHI